MITALFLTLIATAGVLCACAAVTALGGRHCPALSGFGVAYAAAAVATTLPGYREMPLAIALFALAVAAWIGAAVAGLRARRDPCDCAECAADARARKAAAEEAR